MILRSLVKRDGGVCLVFGEYLQGMIEVLKWLGEDADQNILEDGPCDSLQMCQLHDHLGQLLFDV